jgi:cell division septation protein DedD
MAQSTPQLSGKGAGRAVFGWAVLVFLIAAGMFSLGLLVGRGTAPIEFDLDRLKKRIDGLAAAENGPRPGKAADKPAQMKNQTSLDFPEVLPKNRDDAEGWAPPAPPAAAARPEPPAAKPAAPPPPAAKPDKPPAPAAAPPGGSFTVQVSAVRSEEEARRLLERLREKGYAGYLEAVATPDKGRLFRVRMGEFPSKEFARGTLERLQKDGFAPMVVPK